MVIDPSTEVLVSSSKVPSLSPWRRAGKKPHISSIHRWTTTGCKEVILEGIQVGGTSCTSGEDLAWSFDSLTYGADGEQPMRCPAERRRAFEASSRELAMEGS
jgi:hypothetical protein